VPSCQGGHPSAVLTCTARVLTCTARARRDVTRMVPTLRVDFGGVTTQPVYSHHHSHSVLNVMSADSSSKLSGEVLPGSKGWMTKASKGVAEDDKPVLGRSTSTPTQSTRIDRDHASKTKLQRAAAATTTAAAESDSSDDDSSSSSDASESAMMVTSRMIVPPLGSTSMMPGRSWLYQLIPSLDHPNDDEIGVAEYVALDILNRYGARKALAEYLVSNCRKVVYVWKFGSNSVEFSLEVRFFGVPYDRNTLMAACSFLTSETKRLMVSREVRDDVDEADSMDGRSVAFAAFVMGDDPELLSLHASEMSKKINPKKRSLESSNSSSESPCGSDCQCGSSDDEDDDAGSDTSATPPLAQPAKKKRVIACTVCGAQIDRVRMKNSRALFMCLHDDACVDIVICNDKCRTHHMHSDHLGLVKQSKQVNAK
jgi:hypothetical protein